jgi:hypothetical protein
MKSIDSTAYTSRFRGYSPIFKLLVVLFILIGSLLSKNFLVPLAIGLIGLFLIYYSTYFNPPNIFSLICWSTLSFFAFSSIFLIF